MAETQPQSQSLSLLRSLQAETLLQGFGVMKVLREVRPSMFYKEKPLAEHFEAIQESISRIGWMTLRSKVDITTASEYLVELATNYERILDGVNRCTMDTQNLRARCKTIRAKITTMETPFHVLWSIGAAEITAGAPGLKKVNDKDWKALAAMEFTAIVEEADQELDAMIEALDSTLDNLKTMRRTAAETYSIGKDQVNAALSELDQADKGIGQGTGQVPQRAAIVALAGLFGSRVKEPQVGTQPVEDDLPEDPAPTEEADPEPAPTPEPPAVPVAEIPKPEAPKEETKPRRERKTKDLTPTVTVVEPPAEAKIDEPPPVVETVPPPPTTDIQKAIQGDPFISTTQKEEILQKDLPGVPKLEDEDDFPGEVAPPAATTSQEEDDFPVGAEVVNATPASKELVGQGETKTPAPETKPAETAKPKADTKPVTETKPRPAGGLFGKRTLPPNMEAAPAFVPKNTPAGNEGLEEFM